MKRWCILIVVCTIIICIMQALSRPVQNPADYVGKWYCCTNGSAYLFHNGIIINDKHNLFLNQEEVFSGAYVFDNKKIILFIISADGVEQIKELQLVSQTNGDALCEVSGNNVITIYHRNKNVAKSRCPK